MKLVLTYGTYNPPTVCDAALIAHLANHRAFDTKVLILTNDRFDRNNPMGVLERQQVISGLMSLGMELYMDSHITEFLNNESDQYESITYVHAAGFPKAGLRTIKKRSKVPLEFVSYDVGDSQFAADELMAGLLGEDFDLFSKYYGGDTNTKVEYFNKMKDRVKCLN